VTKVTDPQFLVDYWMAPPDVVARVRQNFQEMDSYYRAHVFDLRPDDERAFYVEPHLDDVIRSDREDQARNEARGRADLVRPDLRILSFSADGAAVQVSQEFHGEPVPVFDRRTHQLIREERSPVGLAIFTLVYDSSDDRWKICSTTFVPGPPGLK
jgi:hypothetical protein